MASNNLCTICGKAGIPGLIRGAGKCQYIGTSVRLARYGLTRSKPRKKNPQISD